MRIQTRSTSGVLRFVFNALWLLGLAPLACSGCGRSGPEMAKVSGKVTYQGKPLTKGSISFHPIDSAKGAPASGAIGPDGSYVLQTVQPGDGVRLGEYRVAISTETEEEVLDYIPELAGMPPPPSKSLIPSKYASPETSELVVTVKSGRNSIPIDLK